MWLGERGISDDLKFVKFGRGLGKNERRGLELFCAQHCQLHWAKENVQGVHQGTKKDKLVCKQTHGKLATDLPATATNL